MNTENQHPHDQPPPSPEPDQPGDKPAGASPYAQHAQAAADKAKAAAHDALTVARRLLTNPVAGIGKAHAGLTQDRVLGVAIVFALIAAIGLALAGGLLMRAVIGAMMGATGGIPGFGFRFGAFFQSLLSWLVAILAAGGGVMLFSPMFGGRASPSSSLLISATGFLPLGIAALIGALIGSLLNNRLGMILVMLLMVYGLCYLVMVLNAGLRQISGIEEHKAAFATPTVLSFAALVAGVIGWLFS